MVQVNSIVKPLIVLMTVWATIFFTACRENDLTPTPTPTPTPTQGPNNGILTIADPTLGNGSNTPVPPDGDNDPEPPEGNGEVLSLPSPTDNFTNTVAVFLLDVSTSVQNLCEPQFQEWRADIPEFFITYAHAYHYNERVRNEEFKIGWTTFPPSEPAFDLKLEGLNSFVNYTDWNGKLQNDLSSYRNGLGFADVLDNTAEQLRGKEYDDYQKVIFLISDTYFNYKNQQPSDVSEEKARIIQSLTNIPPDWRLYIIQLPCSKADGEYDITRFTTDTDWWYQTVQGHNHIHLLDRKGLPTLRSVADALFKNNSDNALKNLLPWTPQDGHRGWGWIDGQNIVFQNDVPASWQTDGDTSSLNITAVAVNTSGFQLFADNKPVGNRAYPLSNANTSMLYNYVYSPQQVNDGACTNYSWGFQPETSNQNTVGIFWWQASYPTLELTATVVPSITMNNPHSFSVTATLQGGDDSCYQAQLRINDQIYRDAQDRPELRNIPDLSWYDIPYDPSKLPLQFPVIVDILRRNSTIVSQRPNTLVLSTEQLVDINFVPVWQGASCPTCSISKTMTTTVVSLVFDYASHFHHGMSAPLNPEVYLLTEKTRQRQLAGPTGEEDKGCNQKNLGEGNVLPILNNTDYRLESHLLSLYAYKVDIDGGNIGIETGAEPQFQTIITVNIPETWQTFCAYTLLLLQWPDKLNQDNLRSILCTLEPGGSCEEQNNRVIHQ